MGQMGMKRDKERGERTIISCSGDDGCVDVPMCPQSADARWMLESGNRDSDVEFQATPRLSAIGRWRYAACSQPVSQPTTIGCCLLAHSPTG